MVFQNLLLFISQFHLMDYICNDILMDFKKWTSKPIWIFLTRTSNLCLTNGLFHYNISSDSKNKAYYKRTPPRIV